MRPYGGCLAACLLGACSFQLTFGPAPADDAPPIDARPDAEVVDAEPPHWLPGYSYRKRIDVATGQQVALADFVAAVIVSGDADLAAHARDDGQDLVVTTSNDTILEYELERFDESTGELVLWVRVPSLAPATRLYLYYGGDIRLHDTRATWDPQTYRAAWHLGDAQSGTARDSAGQHDLAASGTSSSPPVTAGIAGGARIFDGSNDSLRDDGDDNTLDFAASESFSYSVWVNVAQSQGEFDMPMYKGGSSAGQAGFDIELGLNNWTSYIGDGAKNRGVTIANQTLNAWVHVAFVVQRSTQEHIGYKDGLQIQKMGIGDIGNIASGSTFVIGSNGGNYWFRGRIDEPRIYARALAPEWIAAEHANLRDPSSFAQVGGEEAMP